MLFLAVTLIYITSPVAPFIQHPRREGRRSTKCLSASTRGGQRSGEFRNSNNPPKFSRKRRDSKKQQHDPKSQPRKNLGAIVFNKWLSYFLREENGSPDEAERLLIEKIKDGTPGEDFDTLSFNLVLNAWARKRTKDSAQRADVLLHTLLQIPQIRADGYSYFAVLNSLAKSGGKRDAALRSEKLLYQMEHSITVDSDYCYNAVMDCWSASGCDDSGRRAQRWLTRLEERGPPPTKVSYNACIKAWARTRNGAPEAHRLIKRMNNIGGDLSPDKISYSTCIDAWCRCTTNLTDAAEKAEELLHHMERESQQNEDLRPDIVAYTSVLYAFAKAGVDTQRAMGLVDRLRLFGKEKPNSTFLNTLIHLFAKRRKIEQAEVLFASMKGSCMADKITYTSVISANANVGNTTRALELLNELEARYEETKDPRFLPTTKTFSSVLYAISRTQDFPGSMDIAERLFDRLFELYRATNDNELIPNTIAYSQVFLILSTSSDPSAPSRALKLMEHMKEEQHSGNRLVNPDAATYAYLISTLTKARTEDAAHRAMEILRDVEKGYESGDDNLKPTKLLYSAVLQAYAKSASRQGAKMAEDLLQRTKNLYRSGKMYAKPTTLYYNAVMDAYARSRQGREAAIRAEELLMELETRCRAGDSELSPTTRSYNAAILAWKNSNATDAPQRAEALLKRMNNRYEAGDTYCRPDRVTFNSIISVWAKSRQDDAPERAETFLNFMVKLHREVGDESLKPDNYSFNSVIDAYSISSSPGAARRAEALYKTMKRMHEEGDRDLKPDIITLTSLRHAWVRSSEKDTHQKLTEIGRLISKERRRERAKKASAFNLVS
jgi:pentatricopeptide repeat protein